jgi:HEAT repeat protein/DNA-binding MarR family transcriptional regulator
MSSSGNPALGPFRGLGAYDESSASLFFGRAEETQALLHLVTKDAARVAALCGEPGVGKTSLLRAGLLPLLSQRNVATVYLGSYANFDQELWQALGRVRGEPPTPGESASDYLTSVARTSPGGTLFVLDHLEELIGDNANPASTVALPALAELLKVAMAGSGSRLRLLLCIDGASFHRLERLHEAAAISPAPGAWMELGRLGEAQVAEILEQTALNTGTFFEAGLADLMAADLCRPGPCLPADLQIVATAAVEQRMTTLRRYERAGGASTILYNFLHRAIVDAGETVAMRILLACADSERLTVGEFTKRSKLPESAVDKAVDVLSARGILRETSGQSEGRLVLSHLCLVPRIREHAAIATAHVQQSRRTLRRRTLTGTALTLIEIRNVRAHLASDLSSEEATTLRRSIRRAILRAGLTVIVLFAVLFGLIFELRTSYTLAFDPAKDSPSSRVVVRRGRSSLAFLNFIPAQPRFGAIIADTGFASTGVATDLYRRITSGHASGTLDKNRGTPIPTWLRTVLDGLGPVPRGISLVLLGDPAGIVSLKQAFVDPALRREALEALAVVGTGGAGEDEILAAALNDQSSDVRRRGVEVAAAIDRRQGKGTHAAILRTALADTSFAVRSTVLHECASLDGATAASILAIALADKDPSFRRMAEKGVMDLAVRAPTAATDAVRQGLGSTDGQSRRTALALLDRIAAAVPREAMSALTLIAADEQAPEEARISALAYLRKNGEAQASLLPVLEKAVAADAPPRLRTAALPIYARLIDPAEVEALATSATKGPPTGRVTAAALWGVVAIKQPDSASRPLKVFLYDQSPDVRAEAARAFGYLKREGPELVRKALVDPNPEVAKAAIESAIRLAAAQPALVAEDLGHAMVKVRPATRKAIVEALGQIGQTRPAAVLPPLAKALKQSEIPTRVSAARAFCELAKKSPLAASPYLRIASRDDNREVRTEAASCLGSLTEGDPKGAARMAVQLAASDEPAVRAAVASSLGALAGEAHDIVLAPLIGLLEDHDRQVRMSAAEALVACGKSGVPVGKLVGELEKKLSAFFGQGDLDERQLVLRVAARLGVAAILRQAARDSDESMRLEAMKAAAAMQPIVLDILQAGAEDRDAFVRAEAVRALSSSSGAGAAKVLPVFETMLRAGDAATRRAGAIALGDVAGASESTTAMLGSVLRQRGESVRSAAAEAIARIAQRDPKNATPLLEQALVDPAYDVRAAAVRGLGAVWAGERSPAEVAAILEGSEADSVRRMVALEALVLQASQPQDAKLKDAKTAKVKEAKDHLDRIAKSGPPLARLAAQVGRVFLTGRREDMHAFLEKLYGG